MNFRLLLKPRFFLRKTRQYKMVVHVQDTQKNDINELKNFANGFIKDISMLRFYKEGDDVVKKEVKMEESIIESEVFVQQSITKKEIPIKETIIKKEIFIQKEIIFSKEIPSQTIKQPEPILKIRQEQIEIPVKKLAPKYVSPISKPIKNMTFPYQFGGIKSYSPNDNKLMRDSLSCINDFQNLYRSLMDATQQKDKSWLEGNVHKDLVQPFLQTKNLFQFNKNMPMNIHFNRFDCFKGVNFENYYMCRPKTFYKYNIRNQYYHFDLFNTSLKAIRPLKPNEKKHGVSFKVVFLSSRKLSQKKDVLHQKQTQQAHEIIFFKQISNQIYSKLLEKITQPLEIQSIPMMFVDIGQTWKIINFDNYLTDPMK